MPTARQKKPSLVCAEKGEVIQEGESGLAVSYEPGAAVETGHRLIDKGLEAARFPKDAPPKP